MTNETKMTVDGQLTKILDPMSFPSGFSKQEFIVLTGGQYPQTLKFELHKDNVTKLQYVQPGDQIKVFFDLRGNENQGKYFVNLVAWRIEKNEQGR